MKIPKSQPFSAEQLQICIAAYALLPELVRRDCGAEFHTDAEQRLFTLRKAMMEAIAEWLGYLLQIRAEPPHKLAHERGLKAYAELDKAWLDLLTETRLRSDAEWMQQFGSALHLWFAIQFEAEHKALCHWGLLQPCSGPLLSKRAWAIAQREHARALIGETEGLKIFWTDSAPKNLTESVNATILSIAETDIEFREKYLRPYLKKQSRGISEVRDCKHMQSIYLDDKGRIALATSKQRGPKIGDRKVSQSNVRALEPLLRLEYCLLSRGESMKNFDLAQGREQIADAMWQRWLALNGAIALPPPGTATEGRKAQKVQPKT